MTVKFRIGFDIDGQTLFGMLAKFLPVENMSVEEVIERPTPKLPKLPKPKAIPQRTIKRASRDGNKPNISGGVNSVVMGVLADGQAHRYRDLKKAVNAAGYAASGIGSRLKRLHEIGAIANVETGLWRKA